MVFMKAPKEHLAGELKQTIECWSDPPKSLQILEILDRCKIENKASEFTINILQTMYDLAIKEENVTHEENVSLATWRK